MSANMHGTGTVHGPFYIVTPSLWCVREPRSLTHRCRGAAITVMIPGGNKEMSSIMADQ